MMRFRRIETFESLAHIFKWNDGKLLQGKASKFHRSIVEGEEGPFKLESLLVVTVSYRDCGVCRRGGLQML